MTTEFALAEAVTQTSGIFEKQVVFCKVNHRGPLPMREVHSTDETTVWRDPGGLEPIYYLFTMTIIIK